MDTMTPDGHSRPARELVGRRVGAVSDDGIDHYRTQHPDPSHSRDARTAFDS